MKKFVICMLSFVFIVFLCGFSSFTQEKNTEKNFDIESLYDYQKEYKTEELEVCARTGAKTYMDYRMTTVVNSRQYQFIHNELKIDPKTGFLYDKDGFVAVALGSYYGKIGDRFYFTLDTGIVLPLVKAEEKADIDTDSRGCYHTIDTSIIEFVIDSDYASQYFWNYDNGLVLNGNYNNFSLFDGNIEKVELVLEEKNDKTVEYSPKTETPNHIDVFNYASGY